jgi:hypothetical protein
VQNTDMLVRLAIVMLASTVLAGAGQAPDLPPRDAFLREVREALTRSQESWHRYAYKERRTDLHLNPFGRMGTGDTKVFEVWPSPNPKLTRRRMIEVNGVAVSRQELDRQDAEHAARIRSSNGDPPDASEQRRNDDLLARRRAQMLVDDVVGTLQFEIARREFRNSRPAIVISFAARPDARPVTRQGRLAKVFRGDIWVDEVSREVTDVRAVAMDDVAFGGGFVAKVYQGMESVIERHEIEPGVWMPTRLTLRGGVRAIFRKAQIDYSVEWFDYRAVP